MSYFTLATFSGRAAATRPREGPMVRIRLPPGMVREPPVPRLRKSQRASYISNETVRCWVLKFGPVITRRLRRQRPQPSNRWHLDEMVVRIAGERMCLWRAVDHEGVVLDGLLQRREQRAGNRVVVRRLDGTSGPAPG